MQPDTRDTFSARMNSFFAPMKPVVRLATWLNVQVYKISGGRLAGRMEGAPVCLVTMTGRKTGRRRTIALMYNAHGEQVLLVASLGGSPKHPVWYHNLKANPEITVQIGRRKQKMSVHEADATEKRELWPVVVRNYPSFASYQRRTTRDIPIMVCSPV